MKDKQLKTDRSSQAGYSLRCLGWLVVIPVAAVALIFAVAGQYQKEWAAARPAGLSDAVWETRKSLCESANMSASDCGITPPAIIERAAAKQREKERLELCSEVATYDAIQNAKKAVSGRLRAPSTAEWTDLKASQQGCEWRVTGIVDAQNAFGGTVRSGFRVRLERTSKQTWVPIEIDIDP